MITGHMALKGEIVTKELGKEGQKQIHAIKKNEWSLDLP